MKMEELLAIYKQAIAIGEQSSAQVPDVMAFVKGRLEVIENPHRALEEELAQLVKAKMPPNGEFYKTRADQSEFAVQFFHRVYGRFYTAGVLRYKSQLQAMDADFSQLLAQYRESVHLLTKREENDEALAKVGSVSEVLRLAGVATRRKNLTA